MKNDTKDTRSTTPEWDRELEDLWAAGLSPDERSRLAALVKGARPEPPQRLWYRLQQIPSATRSGREGHRVRLPRYAAASIVVVLLMITGYEYQAVSRARAVEQRAEQTLEFLVQPDSSLNDIFDQDVLSLGGL